MNNSILRNDPFGLIYFYEPRVHPQNFRKWDLSAKISPRVTQPWRAQIFTRCNFIRVAAEANEAWGWESHFGPLENISLKVSNGIAKMQSGKLRRQVVLVLWRRSSIYPISKAEKLKGEKKNWFFDEWILAHLSLSVLMLKAFTMNELPKFVFAKFPNTTQFNSVGAASE